jgi:membrane protein DedA with SNARE-associated domain
MSATPLPGILGAVAPVLDNYGYLAVAGLVMVENFGVPAPGETILVAAAVYAGTGRLSIVGVGLIAVAAAVIGNCIGYAIGYFGGHALVLRYGKYVFLTKERLDKAERFFARRGGLVVVAGRFIEGLRQAAGIIAGTAEMPWKQFLAFTTLGAVLWVAVWAPLGYLAGDHIGTIYADATRYSLYLLIALVVVLAALIARAVWRRKRGPATEAAETVSAAPDTKGDGS